MRPFQFKPLERPGSEIRLLELLPGSGAIHCRLSVTSLEVAKGKYEPLSYCWGDQTRRTDIVLNDNSTHSIGADLGAALRRLRYQRAVRVLWIDALCINQADTREKSIQVPLMAHIYQCGRRTLVWLGEHDSKTAPAFSLLEFIAAQARNHPPQAEVLTRRWVDKYWREKPKRSLCRIAPASLVVWRRQSRGMSQLESVFSRPWFKRVWIIQEISTSPEVLVICGAHKISWEAIEAASAVSADKWEGDDYLLSLIGHREEFQNSVNTTLSGKILDVSHLQATNPRDRIYAVLGLVSPKNQGQHGIAVDYDAEADVVFRDTTAHCLRTSGTADILYVSSGCCGQELTGGPSWVLYPGRPIYDPRHCFESWAASGPSACRPVFDTTHSLLGVPGLILDKVASVGSTRGGFSGSRASVMALIRWFRRLTMQTPCYFEWRALAGFQNDQLYQYSSEPRYEAFRRTLFAQVTSADDIAGDEEKERFQRFDQFMVREFPFLANRPQERVRTRDELRVMLKYTKLMLQALFVESEDFDACSFFHSRTGWCAGKRFVVTERGYIGIAPRAQKDDHVVLLEGAKMPFILRPDGPTSTMIGPCYVHGIMDGEAWDESACDIVWIK